MFLIIHINLILHSLVFIERFNLLFFNDKSKENKLLEAVHLKIKNQKLEIEKIINQKKDLLK